MRGPSRLPHFIILNLNFLQLIVYPGVPSHHTAGGFWAGGLLEHALYNCPCEDCLKHPRQTGPKGFVALNDLNISVHWLF